MVATAGTPAILRAMHDRPNEVLTDAYKEDEYWDDLLRVTGGQTDESLARMTIRASSGVFGWMKAAGVRFQPSLTGTLNLGRTNAFFLGGGKALVNAYYLTAEKLGVEILYDTEVVAVNLDDGTARSVDITYKGFPETIRARCVIASSGGFQANLDWMREYWGDAVDNFVIRGTPYNRGRILKNLLDQGVGAVGDPTQFHAVALDARAPKFDGGITTRLDSVPYSVVVNRNGERFYDEGEDVWPKRYAIWGRLIAQQPGQIAYSICDTKAFPLFMPSVFPAMKANSLEELAVQTEAGPGEGSRNDRRLQPSGKARAGVRQPETGRQRDRGSDAEQDQLGARGGQTTVLRLPAAPRHHLHLPQRSGERQGAGADGERSARRQPVRIRRDHVGQYPRQGVSRRVRHDHRDGVRPHRRPGGSASCKKLTPLKMLGGKWRFAMLADTVKDFVRFFRRWNCVASSHPAI